jgi:hypothetical protein
VASAAPDPSFEPSEVARASSAEIEPELPPISPPQTKAPIQFNQQVNIYQQIPQSAWDRLNSEQVVELSKAIIQQIDNADKRQFDYVIEQANKEQSGKKMAIIAGSIVTVLGFAATAYLSLHGQTIAGLSISLPLATILAVLVGKRFLD